MRIKAFGVFIATSCLLWPSVAGATFSIIARDAATGEIGYAVASKVFAVRLGGSVIDPDVGVVARQADVRLKHGPRAMELLKSGLAPADVIAQMLKEDLAATHQIAILDLTGRIAASTGAAATAWKGHKIGDHYSVQGNLLVGPEVIDAMANAFEKTKGPLAERLFAALKAGDDAGGDKRGRQSAFMTVVRKGASVYGEPMVNIAVDDSPNPLQEMRRLLHVQTAWNLAMGLQPLVLNGKMREARATAKQMVALAPDDQAYRMWLGVLEYLEGDRFEALKALRAARQMGDERVKPFFESLRFYRAFRPFLDDAAFHASIFQ